MAADGSMMAQATSAGMSSAQSGTASRANRAAFVAFVADAPNELMLRKGLEDAMPEGIDVRRATVRQAIAALSRMPTPRTLLIDISGDPQPLTALADLAQVVEPDVRVLIIGDRDDVTFYRQVTRGLGAHEYLYKPLVPEMVARHFGPQILRGDTMQAVISDGARGGRMIAVMGARGGVGATTIASNLAWHFSNTAMRHTVLLDSDLHAGTAAMLLGARTGPGLRAAMEQPARIDELFVERAALPVNDRLHLLAGEEKLTETIGFAAGAADRLVGILRRRYNFVVADIGFSTVSPMRELLMQAHQRVIVLTPTLPSVRDALRLLALPSGPFQARRAVLMLNRAGMPGGLTRKQVEDALRLEIDVVMPDLSKQVCQAETMGTPASVSCAPFRAGIAALAGEVAAAPAIAKPKRRFLGLLK